MSREIVSGRGLPGPGALGFGDVVLHGLQGRGMVYGVTNDGSLMIAFEEGCVCTGYQGLTYVGSILDLEAPAKPARVPKKSAQNLLGTD